MSGETYFDITYQCGHVTDDHRMFSKAWKKSAKSKWILLKKAVSSHNHTQQWYYCVRKGPLSISSAYNGRNPDDEEAANFRNKVQIIKHPRCEKYQEQIETEIGICMHLASVEIEKTCPGILRMENYETGPDAYIVLPWMRGGTLQEYTRRRALERKAMPPGFLWHVVASLLNTIIEIHGGYPNMKRMAVNHGAPEDSITDYVMFDAMNSSYEPYPDIKLVDFCNASLGPKTKQGVDADIEFKKGFNEDLKMIGTLLRIEGRKIAKYMAEHRLEESKGFTDKDDCFQKAVKILENPDVEELSKTDGLNKLLKDIEARRDEERKNLEPHELKFDAGKWDVGKTIITAQFISDAMKILSIDF